MQYIFQQRERGVRHGDSDVGAPGVAASVLCKSHAQETSPAQPTLPGSRTHGGRCALSSNLQKLSEETGVTQHSSARQPRRRGCSRCGPGRRSG